MAKDMQMALDAMFSKENIADVKFFLGTGKATADELISEVVKADAQIRSGAAIRSDKIDSELLS